MFEQMTIKDFTDILSTKEPVPGGGGASGLCAGVGMALGSMVANLTSGKKKYAAYQKEIEEILEKAEKIRAELLDGMNRDAEAFEPLSKAYGLPKETPEQIAAREEVLAGALLDASNAPLALMAKILEAMALMERLSEIGSKLAISDVGVGAQLLLASLKGASLNVYINTNLMKDRALAESLNKKANRMIMQGEMLTQVTYERVLKKIQ